ncbi:MAG: cobalamin-dependent protein [Bacteroidota bacterium]
MVPEVIYLHYMNALLEGDKKQCFRIVDSLIEEKTCIKDIYIDLFQRSMYRIGQLWEKERCSVAREHIATKITESLVEFTVSRLADKKETGKVVIITCINKEFHELGARMVAGLFEVHGWNSIFLGSNTPQNELVELIRQRKPQIVGISNNFYINTCRLVKLIDLLKTEFPGLNIIVGGQSLADGRAACLCKFNDVRYINSLDELEEFLQNKFKVLKGSL